MRLEALQMSREKSEYRFISWSSLREQDKQPTFFVPASAMEA
jgi:hypothetical protein